MTALQKTLITAALVVTAGAGIYEAHQASTLREQAQTFQEQIQALQVQQAPLNQQIQQLQQERARTMDQLAAMKQDVAQATPDQKAAALSESAGGAGRAQGQSISADNGSNASSTGMAKLMGDPKMKEYIQQVQLGKIKERYGPLFQELKLSPEDTEKFTQLIGGEWLKFYDLGSSTAEGKTDLAAARQALAEAPKEIEGQLQSLLCPAGYARYNELNQEFPARTTVNMLNNQWGDNPLSDDQTTRLFQLVKAEPYTLTHGISGELDLAFFGSQEEIDQHLQQVTESHQRVLDQAASFLTPPQLAALATLQSDSFKAQKLQGAALTQKH